MRPGQTISSSVGTSGSPLISGPFQTGAAIDKFAGRDLLSCRLRAVCKAAHSQPGPIRLGMPSGDRACHTGLGPIRYQGFSKERCDEADHHHLWIANQPALGTRQWRSSHNTSQIQCMLDCRERQQSGNGKNRNEDSVPVIVPGGDSTSDLGLLGPDAGLGRRSRPWQTWTTHPQSLKPGPGSDPMDVQCRRQTSTKH